MSKEIKIGLFGFGVVGQGLFEIISSGTSLPVSIAKICVKDKAKRRTLPMDRFTFDRFDILNDPEVDLIVEAIDDHEAAFEISSYALSNGKNVVTVNKKMLAKHLEELMVLQKENRTSLLYEGSACASIPILRTLEEYYDNDLVRGVSGIFNGSTNYILTKIFNENRDYDIALKRAQDLGFVESNPSLDIVGYDSLYKLLIIATHAYGLFIDPDDVVVHGIQYISRYDIEYAQERNAVVKHVACLRSDQDNNVSLYVLPRFVYPDDELYTVHDEYNAVTVEAAFSGKQYFKGKGAGGHATGFAMFSDISANMYGYKYEYKKHLQPISFEHTNDQEIEVYFRYFDKKNLDKFSFSKIKAKFESESYSYVIGNIKLSELLEKIDVLNTADIFVVVTGKN